MSTYSLIQNGDPGLEVRNTINALLQDINDGVYIGPTGPAGEQGPQGEVGPTGPGFSISGTAGGVAFFNPDTGPIKI